MGQFGQLAAGQTESRGAALSAQVAPAFQAAHKAAAAFPAFAAFVLHEFCEK